MYNAFFTASGFGNQNVQQRLLQVEDYGKIGKMREAEMLL